MDMYDFGGEAACTYSRKCECGNIIEVSTQKDDEPEYYTDIYVRCSCGKSVLFMLPVH
jgi:hypothetical protein